MKRVSKLITTCAMAALVAVAANCEVSAQGHPFPVSFKYHCGGKARYTIPKAMGFSPDGKTLAIWYKRSLIFLETATGKEITRVRTADELSYGAPYNYVIFDPTRSRCCICEIGSAGVLLQFFDVEAGIGSAPVAHQFDDSYTSANHRDYVSDRHYLPLRQWFAFQSVGDELEAACEVVFPQTAAQPESRQRFRVSFRGNQRLARAEQIYSSLQSRLKKAEQFWSAIVGASAVNSERLQRAGSGMQVALSLDQQTLLTQFIYRHEACCEYRFRFYDTASNKKLTEIRMLTNIDWRFPRGSRGFAFSPDFRCLARTMPGGHVVVHDLSMLVERKLDDATPIEVSVGHDGTTTGK